MRAKLWFALYTQPHKEYLVRDKLAGDGLHIYLPELTNKVKRSDRRLRRPFFPHYLFVQDPGPDRLAQVRWTPGLRQIVSCGGLPAGIPDEVVRQIRIRLKTFEERADEPFAPGETVHIMRGPFEGMDAIFERRLSSRGRVRVLLEMINRVHVPVEMDLHDLMPPA